MKIGYVLKKLSSYTNFFIFIMALLLLGTLQSTTHISTSLLSILPNGESKEIIKNFNETQNAKILLLSVEGFDEDALARINYYKKEFDVILGVTQKEMHGNVDLQKHQEKYKLYTGELDSEKLLNINAKKELEEIYIQMKTSFVPVQVDKVDPFLLIKKDHRRNIKLKNGHLTLGAYGYLSVFSLESNSLEEHQKIYNQIDSIVGEKKNVKVFSPLFYYVENSETIRTDVNHIIYIAMSILLLMYLLLLRNIALLLNTISTLATSSIVALILLTQVYDEVSIFVLVFGISISSIAIDYMFHHYMHGYYKQAKPYNKEVLFGFLTTITAFFILSFTSFLLIKQIAIFSIASLFISYVHFAFIYPHIGFKLAVSSEGKRWRNLHSIQPKVLVLFSVLTIVFSSFWIEFDFNLKNIDVDNTKLKQTESFFYKHMGDHQNRNFMLKAKSIDTLITHAKEIVQNTPTSKVDLSVLVSSTSFGKNKITILKLQGLKQSLEDESNKLGFKKEYFKEAYQPIKSPPKYTMDQIQDYGIDILKIGEYYITYGMVDKVDYKNILKYSYVEDLSLKERFEVSMQSTMTVLMILGFLSVLVTIGLIYLFTKKAIFYALNFLLFPVAIFSIYALFVTINILHLFMIFIILAIGIDYAIYLSRENDRQTTRAIHYSLVSTFAGFGVLVFSDLNALHSMGIVATMGILSLIVLLLFLKGENDVS